MSKGGLFTKKTIRDVPLEHRTVLIRADYNVPLTAEGKISDDYRLVQSLPTLRYLIKAGCKLVIMSHLGRPGGEYDAKFSLEPVAERLSELLGKKVGFVPECIGDQVKVAAKTLKAGEVLMLENVRFHKGDEQNDPEFSKKLAESSNATYFVQDGFGVVHRAHASTEGVTHLLPSVSGLLVEKEATSIRGALENPKRPLVAVLGGAKVSDKIKVVERFVDIADRVIIGGAMANTFLKYKGLPIGKSKFEEGQEDIIAKVYDAALRKAGHEVNDFIVLPTDVAVAPAIGPGQKRTVVSVHDVRPEDYILDLGPETTETMLGYIKDAHTVLWSGTLGLTEQLVFAYSSAKLASALASQKDTFSVVGGGDTADFVLHWDKRQRNGINLVSTGGSASLELMAGQKLPGIEALLDA